MSKTTTKDKNLNNIISQVEKELNKFHPSDKLVVELHSKFIVDIEKILYKFIDSFKKQCEVGRPTKASENEFLKYIHLLGIMHSILENAEKIKSKNRLSKLTMLLFVNLKKEVKMIDCY